MKILVAEDEVITLRMIGRILERAGFEVISVDDGRKAVDQLCKADGPRIALIDWMMPELDGPGVCREMRERNHHYIHILVLTSKNSKRDVVKALEAGANDYLVKPFDSEELKARIGVGMRILQLEDDLVQAREDMRYKATHDALTSVLSRGAYPRSAKTQTGQDTQTMAAHTSLHSDRNGSWSLPVAWSP